MNDQSTVRAPCSGHFVINIMMVFHERVCAYLAVIQSDGDSGKQDMNIDIL